LPETERLVQSRPGLVEFSPEPQASRIVVGLPQPPKQIVDAHKCPNRHTRVSRRAPLAANGLAWLDLKDPPRRHPHDKVVAKWCHRDNGLVTLTDLNVSRVL
jgi:hypothetical protein